jgi:hypothetical protein
MLIGHLLGHVSGPAKLLDRFDHMIRRHDQHSRQRILPSNQSRPQADAGGRISPHRFSDDMIGRHGLELLDHLSGVHGRRDHPGVLRPNVSLDPIKRLLEERPIAG